MWNAEWSTSNLSWSEHGASNSKAVSLIPHSLKIWTWWSFWLPSISILWFCLKLCESHCVWTGHFNATALPDYSILGIVARIRSPIQELAESQLGREDSWPGGCSVLSYVSYLDKKTRSNALAWEYCSLHTWSPVYSFHIRKQSLCKAKRGQKKDVGSAASCASEKNLWTAIKLMEKNSN